MEIKLNAVNQLPSPTWNRLHVNQASLSFEGTAEKVIFPPDPFSLPDGVVWCKNQTALPEYQTIKTGMGEEIKNLMDKFCVPASVLTIEAKQRPADAIRFNWELKNQEAGLQYLLVHAKANSEATILMSVSSSPKAKGLHGSQILILAEEGARLHLIQTQLLGQEYTHFQDIGVSLSDRASFQLTQIELGGLQIYCGCHVELQGKETSFDNNTYFLGHGSQVLDMNYTAVHRGEKSVCSMEAKGALMGKAFKLYRGTIDFIQGCKGSSGSEGEDVLLLNPGVRNQTAPLILCREEDVEGDHHASVGEVDSKQLFYLMSRGINELEAKKLMALGHIEAACREIPDKALSRSVIEFSQEVFKNESIPQ